MENPLIYRFCQEKIGIGIDADIHQEKELPAGLRKIPDFRKSAAIWIIFQQSKNFPWVI